MRYNFLLFILTILLFSTNRGYCQDDFGYIDPMITADLGNSIYDNFFATSCTSGLKSAKARTNYKYCQLDNPWQGKSLGGDSCSGCYISSCGCALTCMTMILKNKGETVDPGTFQVWMKAQKNLGFYLSGCSVNWNASDNFGSKTIKQSGIAKIKSTDSVPYERLRTTITNGGYIIVHGDNKKKAKCWHYFLIYDFTGSGTKDSDFLISDPEYENDVVDGNNLTLADHILCTNGNNNFIFYLPNTIKAKLIINNLSGKAIHGPTTQSYGCTLDYIGYKSAHKLKDCTENILWVIKDDNGNIVDSQVGSDSYFTPILSSGIYTISVAVSNEDGYDIESTELIVDNLTTYPVLTINPDGSTVIPDPTCPTVSKWDKTTCPGTFSTFGGSFAGCPSGRCICYHNFDEGFSVEECNYGHPIYLCKTALVCIAPIDQSCDQNYFEPNIPYFISITECSDFGKFISPEKYKWISKPNYGSFLVRDYIDGPSDPPGWDVLDELLDTIKTTTLYKLEIADTLDGIWHGYTQYIYFLDDNLTIINPLQKINAVKNIITLQNANYTNVNTQIIAGNTITLLPGTVLSETTSDTIVAEIDPTLQSPCCTNYSASLQKSSKILYNVTNPALIEPVNNEASISIYPNPNKGSFTVSLINEQVSEISIVNIFGQVVQFNTNNNVGSSFTISLPGECKGMYLLRLKGRQKTYTQKIVVE